MRSKIAPRRCRENHRVLCAVCGITQEAVLDACHIDQNPANDDPDNLVWLCKTHHRMMDCGLYPAAGIKLLRDHWNSNGTEPNHLLYIKDGALKAAATRRKSATARRAWATRRANQGDSAD